jgi:hypothetical protein
MARMTNEKKIAMMVLTKTKMTDHNKMKMENVCRP